MIFLQLSEMNKIYYTLVLLCSICCAYTQSPQSVRCHTDTYMEQLLSDPDRLLNYKEYRKSVDTSLDFNKSINCTSPIIIPVAVHYSGNITSGNSTCLIDKAIEQIAVLNEDFGGYNASLSNYCTLSTSCCSTYPADAVGQGTCLQFCLATMNHPSTSGLVNANYAITSGTYTFDSNASPWKGYLNLFVSDISPMGTPSTLLGLAPVGGGMDPDGNGVFITARAFGGVGSACTSGIAIDNDGIYNLGRTGTHEVGHYFGLNHIFFGNCSTGDGIADTPQQTMPNYGCPTTNTSSCTSDAENTCSTEDFYFNFMDYVDDPCMYMFTDDQGQVMYSTALLASNPSNESYKNNVTVCSSTPTYNPTYPAGCTGTGMVSASFTRDPVGNPLGICQNDNIISFTDTSVGCGVMNYSWSFSGAGVSPTTSTLANPEITVTMSGPLTVSLTASNTNTSDTQTETITINYLPSSDPSCTAPCLLSSTGPYIDLFNASSCFESCPTVSPNFQVFTNESYFLAGLESGTNYTIDFCNGYSTANWTAIITFASIDFSTGMTGNALATTEGCSLTFTPPSAGDYIVFVTEKNDCGGNTQFISNGLLTWATDCATCPAADGAIFTDSSGENAFYRNNLDESYTICPDATDELVSVEFSSIGIQGSVGNCTDRLEVFYGSSTSGTPDHTLCGSSINALDQAGVYEGKDYGACISFRFISDGSSFDNGWVANVASCTTTLNNGVSDGKISFAPTNAGAPIGVITVNNTCAIDGNINDVTSIQSGNSPLSKMSCIANSSTLSNQVFYAIETNDDPNTQTLEIEVEDLTTNGAIDAILYGPVTGSYPNFTGGTALACDDSPDANGFYQVSINNAGVSQVFILIIATENEGSFRFASTTNASALPVELTQLAISRKGQNDALLNWTTQSEINNLGFHIERSTDQIEYTKIGFVKAEEGVSQTNKYQYYDIDLDINKTHYYRLKQEDLDGNIQYSQIVSLSFERSNNIVISPIPSADRIYVSFQGYQEEGEIKIYDGIGKLVLQSKKAAGISIMEIDVNPFDDGIYYMITTIEENSEIAKFIIAK